MAGLQTTKCRPDGPPAAHAGQALTIEDWIVTASAATGFELEKDSIQVDAGILADDQVGWGVRT